MKIISIILVCFFALNIATAFSEDKVKHPHMFSFTADNMIKAYVTTKERSNQGATYTDEQKDFYFGVNYAYAFSPMVQLQTGLHFQNEKIITNDRLDFTIPVKTTEVTYKSIEVEFGPLFNVLTAGNDDIENAYYVSILVGYKQYFGMTKNQTKKTLGMHLGKRFRLFKSEGSSLTFSPNIFVKESRWTNATIRSQTEQGINLLGFDFFF